MQPDPWSGVEPEHKSVEPSIDGTVSLGGDNFNGQIIMLQPPSSSSKVIGILLIVYGAFNLISLLLSVVGFTDSEFMEDSENKMEDLNKQLAVYEKMAASFRKLD